MVPKNEPYKGRPGDTTDLNLAISFLSHRFVLMMLSDSPQNDYESGSSVYVPSSSRKFLS